MTRHHAKIADELVCFLAHDAASGEVLDDAVEQARIAQQPQRLGPLLVGQLRLRLLRRKRLFDLLVAQILQLEKHLPHIVPDDLFPDAQLRRRLFHEGHALPCSVQLQRVHMQSHVAMHVHAQDAEIYFQQLCARVLLQPAHPVLAVAEAHHHIFAAHLNRHVDLVRNRGRRRLRRRRKNSS